MPYTSLGRSGLRVSRLCLGTMNFDPQTSEADSFVIMNQALCQELGEEPADLALAWLLHNPVVTAPIIGPRTVEQLAGSLRADEAARRDVAWPWRRGTRGLRMVARLVERPD